MRSGTGREAGLGHGFLRAHREAGVGGIAIKPGKVTVAGKLSLDLAVGTLKNIFRQAGMKR